MRKGMADLSGINVCVTLPGKNPQSAKVPVEGRGETEQVEEGR